jgi:DNA (cytosine-5)-methyltransferase 1
MPARSSALQLRLEIHPFDAPVYHHSLVAEDPATFVDLFAGVGGLTLGLERAGFRSLLAVDHWNDAVRTYLRNFSDHAAVVAGVESLSARRLAKLLPERPQWIVGGPPCQGYSTVGKRNRTDPRNRLFLEFHRIVKQLKPDGFVIENVLGLKDMSFEEEVAAEFENIGYAVEFRVLRAADFGVPQLRRRVVFVGHRSNGHFLFPEETHDNDQRVTVWEAIGDLPALAPGDRADRYDKPAFSDFQQVMRHPDGLLTSHEASRHPDQLVRAISHIPDGGNRFDIPEKLQPRSGFHNSYSRLDSRLPAVAVTQNMGKPSGTRCIHPFQHRGLTAREGARLQSFPDTFHFEGGVTSQRLQIANAVPPLLAEAIGLALLDVSRWKSV